MSAIMSQQLNRLERLRLRGDYTGSTPVYGHNKVQRDFQRYYNNRQQRLYRQLQTVIYCLFRTLNSVRIVQMNIKCRLDAVRWLKSEETINYNRRTHLQMAVYKQLLSVVLQRPHGYTKTALCRVKLLDTILCQEVTHGEERRR